MRRPPFSAVADDIVGRVRTFSPVSAGVGPVNEDEHSSGVDEVLAGWSISRCANGEISLMAPECDPGAITLGPNERSLAGRLLFKLADDLLDREARSLVA